MKILKWPQTFNSSEVRSLLGLAFYYRKFIQNFAPSPHRCTNSWRSKPCVSWSRHCQTAHEKLKRRLTSAPILAYPDFCAPFIFSADAFDHEIGEVLLQHFNGDEQAFAYGSRSRSKAETHYSVTTKQMLAPTFFVDNFRHYLLGGEFKCRTDHSALQWFRTFKNPEGQVARWLEKLMANSLGTPLPPSAVNSFHISTRKTGGDRRKLPSPLQPSVYHEPYCTGAMRAPDELSVLKFPGRC